jgi:hypothetical protein
MSGAKASSRYLPGSFSGFLSESRNSETAPFVVINVGQDIAAVSAIRPKFLCSHRSSGIFFAPSGK